MSAIAPEIQKTAPAQADPQKTPPFGSNELRLSAREWVISLGIVMVCMIAVPRVWKAFESFSPGPDYRIPYALSKDYWLYQRRLEQVTTSDRILVLGDSVVWGEYVRPDGTLSHFLNAQTGSDNRFVNCGINGLFPLSMEGLVANYGNAIRNSKVIVHCNVLWMTAPQRDLSDPHPQSFNHSRLIPQFVPRVPSYGADANERLSALIDQHVPYFAWASHIQNAYFDQRSIPQWTLEQTDDLPPKYPNAWRNPIAVLNSGIPSEPAIDPDRGLSSRRHIPWNVGGEGPSEFDWVPLDQSVQWKAFQRTVEKLRDRGNHVLVIFGPFNEHMIAPEQVPTFDAMRQQIVKWLKEDRFPVVVPRTLPSELYADASHPLTQGYELLAHELANDPVFRQFAAH